MMHQYKNHFLMELASMINLLLFVIHQVVNQKSVQQLLLPKLLLQQY
jgi:hypothetical protein